MFFVPPLFLHNGAVPNLKCRLTKLVTTARVVRNLRTFLHARTYRRHKSDVKIIILLVGVQVAHVEAGEEKKCKWHFDWWSQVSFPQAEWSLLERCTEFAAILLFAVFSRNFFTDDHTQCVVGCILVLRIYIHESYITSRYVLYCHGRYIIIYYRYYMLRRSRKIAQFAREIDSGIRSVFKWDDVTLNNARYY